MRNEFDTKAFYAALDSQRQSKDLNWKDVAQITGVGASTLTRMAQGKSPDANGLAALLAWSGFQATAFLPVDAATNDEPETMAKITAVLRADPTLSPESASALEDILKAAYVRFKE